MKPVSKEIRLELMDQFWKLALEYLEAETNEGIWHGLQLPSLEPLEGQQGLFLAEDIKDWSRNEIS